MARYPGLGLLERVWDDIRGRASLDKYKLNLKILLVLTILAFIVTTVGWFMFGPVKSGVSRERRAAAKECARAVREVLRENRGEYRVAFCAPFVGDSTDAVFYAVVEELSSAGTFDVKSMSPFVRIRRFLGLSLKGTDDAKVAARKARRGRADVALCGAVRRFESTSDGVDLVLEYRLIDAATGVEAFSGVYDSKEARDEESTAAAAAQDEVADAGDAAATDDRAVTTGETATRSVPLTSARDLEDSRWGGARGDDDESFLDELRSRIVGACWWTLAALAIPILAFPVLENLAALRSNAANFFALFLCFLADALCAWLFVTPTFQNWISWLGVAAMALFALFYNFQILHLAHRRTEPARAGF